MPIMTPSNVQPMEFMTRLVKRMILLGNGRAAKISPIVRTKHLTIFFSPKMNFARSSLRIFKLVGSSWMARETIVFGCS